MFLLVFNSSAQELFWNFKEEINQKTQTVNKPKILISEAVLQLNKRTLLIP